jgi:hypothetical protein
LNDLLIILRPGGSTNPCPQENFLKISTQIYEEFQLEWIDRDRRPQDYPILIIL